MGSKIARPRGRSCSFDELETLEKANHLTVLHKLLRTAAQANHFDQSRPPTIVWLKAPKPEFDFLDFAAADRLRAWLARFELFRCYIAWLLTRSFEPHVSKNRQAAGSTA
jgi:hypothetical protein